MLNLASVRELGAINGEVLQVYSQAAIHASLLHASKGVLCHLLIGVDALVEAVKAKSAVV